MSTRKWISDALDTISENIEKIEADLESMPSTKKGKKGENERLDKLQTQLLKLNSHQTKLEKISKLVENDSLDPSQVRTTPATKT